MKRALIAFICGLVIATALSVGAKPQLAQLTKVLPISDLYGWLGEKGYSWDELWIGNAIYFEGNTSDQFEWLLTLSTEPTSDQTYNLIHTGVDSEVTPTMIDNSLDYTLGSLVVSDLSDGSVVFVNSDSKLVEDNSNLYFDDTNDNLGVGVGVPNAGYVNAVEAQVFVLNSPRWDDLRMPAELGKAGAAQPGFTGGSVSNAVGTYCFDKVTDEELYFFAQMPHTYKEGSDIELHLHWYPTTTGLGNVGWVAETEWVNMDGTFGTAFFNAVFDAADGTQYKHQYHDMMTLDGTGKLISSMIATHIFRDANETHFAAGGDNYDADACLLEVDYHYQIDTPGGSANEEGK